LVKIYVHEDGQQLISGWLGVIVPTTFNVLFLGSHASIDATEGDNVADNAAALAGQTYGDAASPLFLEIKAFAPGATGYTGGHADGYDVDNTSSNDTFTIDGGAEQTFDAVAAYNATLTYMDGTTATLSAVVIQDTDGNTYLTPELSAGAEQTSLEAKPIQSITLDSVLSSTSDVLGATREAGNFDDGVQGTSGDDLMGHLYTDADGDMIDGSGNLIAGGDGADSIFDDGGNDTIYGGAGDDSLDGGDHSDLIYGGTGNDTISGGEDVNILDADTLYGGDGNDSIISGDVVGSGSGDALYGEAGNDTLVGGNMADTLDGGADSDTLDGGAGNDQLTGGAGDDLFILNHDGGNDTITDFAAGDQIDTSALTDVGNGATNEDGTVNAYEVVVTGGGGSDQVLTFPNGETLTVPDGTIDTTTTQTQIASLVAMGMPACFAAGTRIETDNGECRVEDLRIGDRIRTADHGLQRLRWIGINAVTFKSPTNLRGDRDKPILFPQGCLGSGTPRRNLAVSPNHRIVLAGRDVFNRFGTSEVLGAAKAMLCAPGVRQMRGQKSVEYYALLFDRHEIIFANGTRTESFLPGPMGIRSFSSAQRSGLERAMAHSGARADMPPARMIIPPRAVKAFLRRPRQNQNTAQKTALSSG
jgi:Ca2+-binding RTX toxin-like protein